MDEVVNPALVRCRLGENGARAFLEAPGPVGPGVLALEELREIIREAGVIHGIREDVLAGIVQAGFNGEPVDIAHGEEGTPGRDGRIEYSFETDTATPHAGAGEDASYVPRVIGNIAAGQPLAVMVPTEP